MIEPYTRNTVLNPQTRRTSPALHPREYIYLLFIDIPMSDIFPLPALVQAVPQLVGTLVEETTARAKSATTSSREKEGVPTSRKQKRRRTQSRGRRSCGGTQRCRWKKRSTPRQPGLPIVLVDSPRKHRDADDMGKGYVPAL